MIVSDRFVGVVWIKRIFLLVVVLLYSLVIRM